MGINTKNFQIDPPKGMTSVKLDSKGSGTVQFTVKNVSASNLDARGILVSIPRLNPPAGVVEKGWVTLAAPTDLHIEKDKEATYVVNVKVPPKSPAGDYSFRLDVANVATPDVSDSSQALAFHVDETKVTPRPKWPWLVAAAVVLLLVVGGVVALLMPKGDKGVAVPDLKGSTVTDATNTLAGLKLTLEQDPPADSSTPQDSGKIVKQDPPAGTNVNSGTAVHVAVGAPAISMPGLIGHTIQEAQAIVNQNGLGVVTSTNASSPQFTTDGIVWQQTPNQGATVKAGTPISLTVTPKKVPVPVLTGMNFVQVWSALASAGLGPGNMTGDKNTVVIGQSPSNTTVPVGTKVDLTFQCTPGQFCGVRNQWQVQQLYYDTVRKPTYQLKILPK
jgi:beta-lactam-binding protein with PASTA domain